MSSNRLSRRGFLMAVVGAIATGTLFANSILDDAIEQFSEDKISIVVRKGKAILTTKFSDQYSKKYGVDQGLMSDLMLYMNNNFDWNDANVDEMRILLGNPASFVGKFDLLSEEALEKLAEWMVPIGVLMGLLRQGRIRVNPDKINGWYELMNNYSKAFDIHLPGEKIVLNSKLEWIV